MDHDRKAIWFLLLLIPLVGIVTHIANKNNKQQTQTHAQTAPAAPAAAGTPQTTVIAKNLAIPWALDFLPDGNIIFTERTGKVKIVNKAGGQVTDVATIPGVKAQSESGLLGIAVHPKFASNNFVYIYYSYAGAGGTQNRVARYTFTNNQMTNPKTLVEGIPGNDFHNGGRLRFGPDGFLYITTGDGNNLKTPQDTNSLGGKILRITDEGAPAPGNPFNNMVYSYGHRNPQGIAWDGTTMYETEHGPSQPSCCDEINKVDAGKNYGWPDVTDTQTKPGTEKNLLSSGQDGGKTWAPSGTAFYNGSIFYAGLKGQALYEAKVNGGTATIVKEHFDNQFGRIRDVVVGPDNQLYITTSNKSAQGGSAKPEDDKIIKVSFGLPEKASPQGGQQPAGGSQPSGIANPSFGMIAPCTNCAKPTDPPLAGGGQTNPARTALEPSKLTMNSQPGAAAGVNPCVTDNAVNNKNKKKKKSKHKKQKGGVSNSTDSLIKLLTDLINILLKKTGGGELPSLKKPC